MRGLCNVYKTTTRVCGQERVGYERIKGSSRPRSHGPAFVDNPSCWSSERCPIPPICLPKISATSLRLIYNIPFPQCFDRATGVLYPSYASSSSEPVLLFTEPPGSVNNFSACIKTLSRSRPLREQPSCAMARNVKAIGQILV